MNGVSVFRVEFVCATSITPCTAETAAAAAAAENEFVFLTFMIHA